MKNTTDRLAQVFQTSGMPIQICRITQNQKLKKTTRCIQKFLQETRTAHQSPKTSKIHFVVKEKVLTR